jgi:hypothetical protein
MTLRPVLERPTYSPEAWASWRESRRHRRETIPDLRGLQPRSSSGVEIIVERFGHVVALRLGEGEVV